MNRGNLDHIRPTLGEQIKEKFGLDTKKTDKKNIDQDILDLAKEYNIDEQFLSNIERREDGKYTIKVTNHFSTKRLPNGYFYIGSAARALLNRNIGIDVAVKPRDIDIIRITDEEELTDEDKQVSAEFMPDDYKYGDGVSFVKDEETYFEEVDFTINAALATDEVITVTKQCLIDTIKHTISLTKYEEQRLIEGLPVSKILAKAIRFYLEQKHKFAEGKMGNIDKKHLNAENYYLSPWWLAVQLNKAFDKGTIFADEYVKELQRLGQIPEYIKDSEQAAIFLLDLIKENGRPFDYSIPLDKLDEDMEDLREEYEKLPKRMGMKKSNKKN